MKLKITTGSHIYIATSFKNQEAFRELKKKLEDSGHTVTHDWTKEDATKVPPEEREEYLNKCAKDDLVGVMNCDMFIFLAAPDMAGAYVELGFALADDKQIMLIDTDKVGIRDCVFYHLVAKAQIVKVKTIDQAVAILNVAKKIKDEIVQGFPDVFNEQPVSGNN